MLALNAISVALWLILALLLWTLLRKLYQAYASPLRDVQGPWLARFTRLWYLRTTYSRQGHKIIMNLHDKYGPIVRIAPNEYGIDDFEASKIIYRSRDPLVKVCGAVLQGPYCCSLIGLCRRHDMQLGAYRMQNRAPLPHLTMLTMLHAYAR